jgi:hypothetical protein
MLTVVDLSKNKLDSSTVRLLQQLASVCNIARSASRCFTSVLNLC